MRLQKYIVATSTYTHYNVYKEVLYMRTNIVLNDSLVEEAMRLSQVKTKKDLINIALEEYIANHKKKNLMDLKGKINFDNEYDYKTMREGK
jgi:Uncharacterized protein conserved in bacteria (DUF2191).